METKPTAFWGVRRPASSRRTLFAAFVLRRKEKGSSPLPQPEGRTPLGPPPRWRRLRARRRGGPAPRSRRAPRAGGGRGSAATWRRRAAAGAGRTTVTAGSSRGGRRAREPWPRPTSSFTTWWWRRGKEPGAGAARAPWPSRRGEKSRRLALGEALTPRRSVERCPVARAGRLQPRRCGVGARGLSAAPLRNGRVPCPALLHSGAVRIVAFSSACAAGPALLGRGELERGGCVCSGKERRSSGAEGFPRPSLLPPRGDADGGCLQRAGPRRARQREPGGGRSAFGATVAAPAGKRVNETSSLRFWEAVMYRRNLDDNEINFWKMEAVRVGGEKSLKRGTGRAGPAGWGLRAASRACLLWGVRAQPAQVRCAGWGGCSPRLAAASSCCSSCCSSGFWSHCAPQEQR